MNIAVCVKQIPDPAVPRHDPRSDLGATYVETYRPSPVSLLGPGVSRFAGPDHRDRWTAVGGLTPKQRSSATSAAPCAPSKGRSGSTTSSALSP